MSDDEILKLLSGALDQVAPGWADEIGELGPRVKLGDLSLDSVALIEMIGALEEELGVSFPEEELARAEEVGDVVALVRTATADASA